MFPIRPQREESVSATATSGSRALVPVVVLTSGLTVFAILHISPLSSLFFLFSRGFQPFQSVSSIQLTLLSNLIPNLRIQVSTNSFYISLIQVSTNNFLRRSLKSL